MPILESIFVIFGVIFIIAIIIGYIWEHRYGITFAIASILGILTGLKFFPDSFIAWLGAIFVYIIIGVFILSRLERT